MPATTVAEYLAALPEDRRAAISAVRKVINDNLPEGYEEGIQFTMIGWYVPHSTYPKGYGLRADIPLPFVSVAAQKGDIVLHMLEMFFDPDFTAWFIEEWNEWDERHKRKSRRGSGERVGRGANQYKKVVKKLRIDRGYLRFRKLDDLPLELIGRAIARMPVAKYIAIFEASQAR